MQCKSLDRKSENHSTKKCDIRWRPRPKLVGKQKCKISFRRLSLSYTYIRMVLSVTAAPDVSTAKCIYADTNVCL